MTKNDRAFLFACIAGDGYLHNGKLRIVHCARQKAYLEYKAGVLGRILCRQNPVHDINNSGYPGVRWEAGNVNILRPLEALFYPDGKKDWLKPEVFGHFNAESLALLWMDDGNITFKRRDGRVHARCGYLSVYGSRERAQLAADLFFATYGVRFIPAKDSHGHRLYANAAELRKVVEIVKPYIHPSMEYKADMRYRRGPYSASSPAAHTAAG